MYLFYRNNKMLVEKDVKVNKTYALFYQLETKENKE